MFINLCVSDVHEQLQYNLMYITFNNTNFIWCNKQQSTIRTL